MLATEDMFWPTAADNNARYSWKSQRGTSTDGGLLIPAVQLMNAGSRAELGCRKGDGPTSHLGNRLGFGSRSVLVLSFALGIAACTDSPTTTTPPGPDFSQASVQELMAMAHGLDRELLEMNAAVPGFAGLRVADDGQLVVRLTPEANQGQAMQVLDATLPARLSARQRTFTPASHEFSELFRWKLIAGQMASDLSLVSIDANEGEGKLTVGVGSAGDIGIVTRALTAAGVPQEVLNPRYS